MNKTINDLLNTASRKLRMVHVMQMRLGANFYHQPLLVVEAINQNKSDAQRNIELARWLRKNKEKH